MEVERHTNNTVVNNLGRNLVNRLKVTFRGETLQDCQGYELLKTNEYLFLPKEERADRLNQRISSLNNIRKLRTNAGVKSTSDANEVALAVIHSKKYCIELECKYLSQVAASYQVGKGFLYENIVLHKTFTISKPNTSVINEHINLPRSSMSGNLFLFTADTEKFINPNIKSISINIDGLRNKLYSEGMIHIDVWETVKNIFSWNIGSAI